MQPMTRVEQSRSRLTSIPDSLPLRLLGTAKTIKTPKNPAPSDVAKRKRWEAAAGRAVARVRDMVLMVSVLEAVDRPGVTLAELKLQDAPVGRPEQEKFLKAEL